MKRIQVFAYARPADLRKGYNGLYGLVVNQMKRDPMEGDAFLFVNRTRRACKVLRYDGTGMTILMKRLDSGQFVSLWAREEGGQIELSQSELNLFLEGAQQVGYSKLSPLLR